MKNFEKFIFSLLHSEKYDVCAAYYTKSKVFT